LKRKINPMKKFYFALLLVFLTNYFSYTQDTKTDSLKAVISKLPDDSVKVNSLIDLGIIKSNSDPKEALEIYDKAIALSEKINYVRGLARSHHQAGLAYFFSADYVMAVEEWKAAEVHYSDIGDMSGVANMLSNSGAIFYNQNEFDNALELYLKALSIAERIGDKKRIATIQQNIGALHSEKKTIDQALEAYLTALALFKELNYSEGIGVASINAGSIYASKEMYDMAMEMNITALKHLRYSSYLAVVMREVGSVNIKMGNFIQGISYLDSALVVASESEDVYETSLALNALALAYEVNDSIPRAIEFYEKSKITALLMDDSNTPLEYATEGLVRLFASKNNYSKAFENQQLLQRIRDRKYNMETDRKFNSLLFNFELEKKEDEIELLSKEQELQKREVKRQKEIRNGIAGGFLIVCLFAITVFVQRNKIKAGKKQSDELLLNILPEEVAAELKEKGAVEAQYIEQTTVLFTDFKGFTTLSEKVTPKELVYDLHACFSEFDRICEKYGIEKIKTIGDAYMAAGGVPTPNTTHAHDVINAALEMAEVVENGKAKKIAAGLPFFEIRVGIHTGPVVAGIVGVKKFQYDIWGDTVNTASRMESSGDVGKVNISEATYELVKNQFTCEYRGEIEAKGKGRIKMYFVGPFEDKSLSLK
jgi:adenylate cyclase